MSQNKNGSQEQKNSNKKPDQGGGSQQPPIGGNRIMFFYLLIVVLLGSWIIYSFAGGLYGPTEITYTTFRAELKSGNIEKIEVQGEKVEGKFKEAIERPLADGETQQISEFYTHVPSFGDDELFSLLEEHEVEIATQPEGNIFWWYLLFGTLPFLILLLIGWSFLRRMQGQNQGMFSIGKSQAKLHTPGDGKKKTTFEDVAGANEAKAELQEIVSYLKDPGTFEELGVSPPKGVLLMGSPGTGKTLLARAVAGEADVPFYTITGSDFMEMFVGVGAKRVRDMFKNARENSPSIIFIDEIDSIGRRRGAGVGGGHDEREQTLNQLLAELDGFEPSENVIVMAATNRPDILDKALLRPGRFDRQVTVDLPTKDDRERILKIHSRNKPLAEDIDLTSIAKGTPGFSGADLENLMNEAAIQTARAKRNKITQEDIDKAWDKVLMGLEREGIVLDEDEKRLIAYHEAGHAIVAAVLPNSDPVHKVTIVPRGKAMGVTQQLPEKEQYIYRREYMLDRLAVMMGGRAAEDLIFNTATSGAENDLKQSTKLARKMVLDWGMSEAFQNIGLGSQTEEVFLGQQMGNMREYSEDTAREVDKAVQIILHDAYQRAETTLKENREAFDKLAEMLVEQEIVMGADVLKLFQNGQIKEKETGKEVVKKAQSKTSKQTSADGQKSDSQKKSTAQQKADSSDGNDGSEESGSAGSQEQRLNESKQGTDSQNSENKSKSKGSENKGDDQPGKGDNS